MGTGSNGQGSGGGNGGKGGNPQGNKPSRSGAQDTTTRKVSFCMDYNEEPAPAKTLKFIEKGFDLTPSPIAVSATVMTETSEAATKMHARGVKLHKKSQERWGPDAR